jgi:hypothetical protein
VSSAAPAGAGPFRATAPEPRANASLDSKRNTPAEPAERFVCKVAPYSIELPLPAVHRAALAITLGKPAALRRLARDLERIGQDVEAGLLDNYAVLLERSNPDRNRLLAEVTRMLRAAAAERRSARRSTPAIQWPPTGLPHGGHVSGEEAVSREEEQQRMPGGTAREPGPATQTPDAAPSASDTPMADESNAVALLPLVTIDARRRASR